MCGELRSQVRRVHWQDGSSPRVRGTRALRKGDGVRGRFIPACAGNSLKAGKVPAERVGSSPRVRGTPACGRWRRLKGRFIPACAGNSRGRRARGRRNSVHPRVCGELQTASSSSANGRGSSPRVRGTRGCHAGPRPAPPVHPRVCGELAPHPQARHPQRRFIPACAGNSNTGPCHAPQVAVHPRVCGELKSRTGTTSRASGSSPRVRGTPSDSVTTRGSRAVHPRVCGELTRLASPSGLRTGSSPRVRGTLHRGWPVTGACRFIPACAGNSAAWRQALGDGPVHPRVCGELPADTLFTGGQRGSSPRVRGTLEDDNPY